MSANTRSLRSSGRAMLLVGGLWLALLAVPAPVAADPWYTDPNFQPGISSLDVLVGNATTDALETLVIQEVFKPFAALGQSGKVTALLRAVTFQSLAHPLYGILVKLAHSLLVLALLAAFYQLMVGRATGSVGLGMTEILARLLLTGFAIHFWQYGLQLLVEVANQLARLGDASVDSFFFDSFDGNFLQNPGSFALGLALVVIYALLIFQAFIRFGLANLLALIGPLAVVGLLLPQTRHWTARWMRLLIITTLTPALQMITLALAARLRQVDGDGFGLFGIGISLVAGYATLKVPMLLLSADHSPAARLALITGTDLSRLWQRADQLRRNFRSATTGFAGRRPTADARLVRSDALGLFRSARWVPGNAVIRGDQAWQPAHTLPAGWRRGFNDRLNRFFAYDPARFGLTSDNHLQRRPEGDPSLSHWSSTGRHWLKVKTLPHQHEYLRWIGDQAMAIRKGFVARHDPVTGLISALGPPPGVAVLRINGDQWVRRLSRFDHDDRQQQGVYRAPGIFREEWRQRYAVIEQPSTRPGQPPTKFIVALNQHDTLQPDGSIRGLDATGAAAIANRRVESRVIGGSAQLVAFERGQLGIVDDTGQVMGLPQGVPAGITSDQVLLHLGRGQALQAPRLGVVDQVGQQIFKPAKMAQIERAEAEGRQIRRIIKREPADGRITSLTYAIQPTTRSVWDWLGARFVEPPVGPHATWLTADPANPRRLVFEQAPRMRNIPGLTRDDRSVYWPRPEAIQEVRRQAGGTVEGVDWRLTVDQPTGLATMAAYKDGAPLPGCERLPIHSLERYLPINYTRPDGLVDDTLVVAGVVAEPATLPALGPLAPLAPDHYHPVELVDVTAERITTATAMNFRRDAELEPGDMVPPVVELGGIRQLEVHIITTPALDSEQALTDGVINLGRRAATWGQ